MVQQDYHLITHILCPYVQRSIILLKEKMIPYSRTDIDLSNKPEWFQRASPMGRVPVLMVNKTRPLFESTVICEYLDETTPGSLHPSDAFERAYHRAWIEFGSGILESIAGLYNAKDQANFENRRREIQRKFELVEKEIRGTPFFAGNKFHFIDAVYGPIFRYFDVFDRVINLQLFDNLPKIQTWRNALRERSSVQMAVAAEYPELLLQFLRAKKSYISSVLYANDACST